jgi:hypothetical protein
VILRDFPDIFGVFPWATSDFPRFSVIFRDFPRFSVIRPEFPRISAIFRDFPRISANFREFPRFSAIFRDFPDRDLAAGYPAKPLGPTYFCTLETHKQAYFA